MEMQRLNNYMEKNEQLYLMLRQCPYEILRQMEVREFKKNSIIYRQGEIQNVFSILAEGIADIYVIGDNGKTYMQSTYSAGDIIGEFEIFSQTPFMSNVKSITDVSLITLNREYFLKWLQSDQNFNQQFIHKIVGTAHRIIKKDEDSKLYSLHQRVCKYLLKRLHPSSTDGVAIHIDKQQLSQQLAVTQRSINRILLNLKDKGIIKMNNSSVIIRNIADLRHEEMNGKS